VRAQSLYSPAYSTSFLAHKMMGDNTSPKNLVHLNQQDIHMRKEQHYNQHVQYLSHFIDKQEYVS